MYPTAQAPRALPALLSLAVTLGLVASLAGLADQQYAQALLAQQGTPAHTAAASAAMPATPRI